MDAQAYLLDTNVLLAALLAPERLPADVVAALSDASVTVHFSAASIWEIAIKRSLNRVDFDFSPQDIQDLAVRTGFIELPITGNACQPLVDLPWHHRDPFDRMLIAQAKALPAYLLTTDDVLCQYSELVTHLSLKP